MNIDNIIKPLNEAQREAVTSPAQAMLILAGAGSGKTKVLVHRIAWQIQAQAVSPQRILAVTFTNKAAQEMNKRITHLLDQPTHSMWVGTFHGLAFRLLRQHAKQAKLPEGFQIIDSADQLKVIKRVLNLLKLNEQACPAKHIQWYINAQKDKGLRAKYSAEPLDASEQHVLRIYVAYEKLCEDAGLLDFSELLLKAHEVLRDTPELLAHYQSKFQHLHVDEFQDTNTVQYAWLRLLAQQHNNLFVVGDDDQSIYGWRGAKIENMYDFQKHFPAHKVIKLEQNYRSTGNILNAANHVIKANEGRMSKTLWTEAGLGNPLLLYRACNEVDEANFVIDRINAWINQAGAYSDIAILYRSNALSRQFEEKLVSAAIPYRVYGGLRFFDRLEVKDALAYLRLLSYHNDDVAFERVINTPSRGLGVKTLADLRTLAYSNASSLWEAACVVISGRHLSLRTTKALAQFVSFINGLTEEIAGLELHEQVSTVIEKSGLIEFYEKTQAESKEERVDNLKELVNAARFFDFDTTPSENQLDTFLAHTMLDSGVAQHNDESPAVQLMTLHSAKGLEFKVVFLVGMEEGLFPSTHSLDSAEQMEEERRLCYVGITRTMAQLYLSYADSRRLYGREMYPRPSRFIREIPSTAMNEVTFSKPRSSFAEPVKTSPLLQGLNLGQRVKHRKFGEGVILNIEGDGHHQKVLIRFYDRSLYENSAEKWLMVSYAQLETL